MFNKQEKDLLVDLGSDQTSLHNPFNGGYYPAGLTFAEGKLFSTQFFC
jgi:urocanate hydratase